MAIVNISVGNYKKKTGGKVYDFEMASLYFKNIILLEKYIQFIFRDERLYFDFPKTKVDGALTLIKNRVTVTRKGLGEKLTPYLGDSTLKYDSKLNMNYVTKEDKKEKKEKKNLIQDPDLDIKVYNDGTKEPYTVLLFKNQMDQIFAPYMAFEYDEEEARLYIKSEDRKTSKNYLSCKKIRIKNPDERGKLLAFTGHSYHIKYDDSKKMYYIKGQKQKGVETSRANIARQEQKIPTSVSTPAPIVKEENPQVNKIKNFTVAITKYENNIRFIFPDEALTIFPKGSYIKFRVRGDRMFIAATESRNEYTFIAGKIVTIPEGKIYGLDMFEGRYVFEYDEIYNKYQTKADMLTKDPAYSQPQELPQELPTEVKVQNVPVVKTTQESIKEDIKEENPDDKLIELLKNKIIKYAMQENYEAVSAVVKVVMLVGEK